MMAKSLYLASEILIFVIILYLSYKILIKSKTWLKFGIVLSCLIGLCWMNMVVFTKVHVAIQHKGVEIDLGHASIENFMIWVSVLIAIVVIVIVSGVNYSGKRTWD